MTVSAPTRLKPVPPAFSETRKTGIVSIFVEFFDDLEAVFARSVEIGEANAALFEIFAHDLEHAGVLAEDDRLVFAFDKRLQEFEEHVVFGRIARFRFFFGENRRVAADLLEAGKRGQHVDLHPVEAIALDQFDELVARRCGIGTVEFLLHIGELAVVDDLGDRRQIVEHIALHAAQNERRDFFAQIFEVFSHALVPRRGCIFRRSGRRC